MRPQQAKRCERNVQVVDGKGSEVASAGGIGIGVSDMCRQLVDKMSKDSVKAKSLMNTASFG